MPSNRRFGALALVCCIWLGACDLGDDEEENKRADDRARSACSRPAPEAPAVTLRYRVESAPTTPGSFEETKSALCARLDKLRLPAVQVRQAGPELVIRAPRRLGEDVELATMPGELRFYDWEPNAVGRRAVDVPFAGPTALFQAVQRASRMSPRAESTDARPGPSDASSPAEADRLNDSSGPRYYLFGADRRLIAGPATNQGTLAGARGGKAPGSRTLRVPQGITVLQAERAAGERRGLERFFVLEDDVELSRSGIARPKAGVDRQTREPVVVFDFNEAGRRSFAALTRRVAERGSGAPAGDPEAAQQRFAITLDTRIVALATVDSRENPQGLDGRTGAQIGGFSSPGQARRVARLLAAPPLPGTFVRVG